MADIANAHHAGQDTAPLTSDASPKAGANGDIAETSKNLLDSLHQAHISSFARNDGDSKKDAEAISGDQDSVKLAEQTNKLAEGLKAYLASGGDFTDAKGAALGRSFVKSLRKERDDHDDDRKTDRQYSGPKGAPDQLQKELIFDSKQIAENARELTKPGLSAEARTNILKGIEAGAAAITANISEHGGKTGKDLNDASAESKVISVDTEALLSGKLTDAQSKLVIEDIGAKAGLIQKEVGDIPNETNYAKHDTAAIKAGGDLEAVVRSAMHSHSHKALQQLTGLLDAYHNDSGKGILDIVVKDRQSDISWEPRYIRANDADNAEHNRPILDFTDPYK